MIVIKEYTKPADSCRGKTYIDYFIKSKIKSVQFYLLVMTYHEMNEQGLANELILWYNRMSGKQNYKSLSMNVICYPYIRRAIVRFLSKLRMNSTCTLSVQYLEFWQTRASWSKMWLVPTSKETVISFLCTALYQLRRGVLPRTRNTSWFSTSVSLSLIKIEFSFIIIKVTIWIWLVHKPLSFFLLINLKTCNRIVCDPTA